MNNKTMEKIKRIKIVDLLKSDNFGEQVNVKGWVRTRRGSKSVNFIALNDGSTINNVQVVADVEKFSDEILKKITTGACLSVNGTLVESVGSGQKAEIQATEIELLGECGSDYPMQKKDRALSICVSTPTCVYAQIPLEPCSVFVIIWQWLFTAISMITDSFISIRRSLRPATAKEPDKCFRLRPRICMT